MIIRPVSNNDINTLWTIFKKIIDLGDTYIWNESTSKDDFKDLWLASDINTYVVDEGVRTVGSYILRPNHFGRGAHIANGSYIVDPACQGRGVGKLICRHSLTEAKRLGFKGIQFNMVVSTNEAAIKLWKSFGFKIIGTTPKGFNHKELGYVDAHIMYLEL